MKYVIRETTLSLILIILPIILFSQENEQSPPYPQFDTWTGIAYSMPVIEKKRGRLISKGIQQHYGENVRDYKSIGTIELDELKIPETIVDDGRFPGVDQATQFCMILNSKMKVLLDACYVISLSSDDGSILWIDGEEIINNDGGHQMTLKTDTIALRQGEYDARLWYFQGLPDRFGLVMDTKIIGKIDACREFEKEERIEIQSRFLFDTGKYTLNIEAHQKLEKLLSKYKGEKIKAIEVIGHTDKIGSEESNMVLSRKRSENIGVTLRQILDNPNIEIKTISKGESEPKYSNETEEGREQNRRVELIIRL